MTRSCARCDWAADSDDTDAPRVQALAHATTAGHPLCTVCARSLNDIEPVVCERCLTRAQRHLSELVEQCALLPDELEHDRAQNALVLLGPGNDGMATREMTYAEWKAAAGAQSHRLGLPGREHRVDNRADDGSSVVFVLHNWAADWRASRGEPAASGRPTLLGAAGYLERRMRSAANGDAQYDPHPAFAEFAHELADLLEEVEHAGMRDDHPERAPVACFDCGSTKSLRRAYRAPDRCDHRRPEFPPPWPGPVPCPISERRLMHKRELKAYLDEHARCDQGGLTDRWTCRVCDREYTDEEYMLALADSMHDVAASRGWGLPWEVAASLGLSVKTVRTWIERQQVASACAVETQRLMVWWPDARDAARARAQRAARRLEAKQRAARRAAEEANQQATGT